MGLWQPLLAVTLWTLVAAAVAQRVPLNAVLHECNQTGLHLVVRTDLWGPSLRLEPQFLLLGSCPVSWENGPQSLLHFQYTFKECGFVRARTLKRVEHSVTLVYRPPPRRGRSHIGPFSTRINCTDFRVDHPTPTGLLSFSGQLSARSALMFTTALMNEDFSSPSDSSVFLLGSQIHIEFAVQRFAHQPLRVYVEECTAAATPELNRSPRNYSIIANHGCLVDSKAAASQFLPRETPHVLRLSLQAFEFVGADTDIYLHCRVLIWDPEVRTDPTRKACWFHRESQRWEILDDSSSSLCSCCDSVCNVLQPRKKRDLNGSRTEEGLHHTVVVGRLRIQKGAQDVGIHSNRSDTTTTIRGGKQSVMPPAVGAVLLEVVVAAVLSVGFCFYNGYQKRCCLCHGGAASPDSEGLLWGGQSCGTVNAPLE